MKYRLLYDWGSDGHKFQDEVFDSVDLAVKHAMKLGYGTNFMIVSIIPWEADIVKCKYSDCPKVKYSDCPVHGKK